ncbi:hypothetical protein HUE87_05210 [Candidatus Sulfurimonas marisnigri]|uniref:Cytochrome c n=1 Tax=Candidatus Sulfurimonas marisnigri TaxID=2740405 RepID=A0A7S7M223_9BACT|nr:hypothetical protein [Candidatus Sulfurimonas marisnigri]QOY55627.1 hypothetical protein HUE87_05210 [Candidatus Sulfurimonas marisnigri]
MNKKTIVSLVAAALLATQLMAADLGALAQGVYAKAGGNKTEAQWTRYFSKPAKLAKFGIDGLSDGDRAALLSYLNERSADKDQSTVPK